MALCVYCGAPISSMVQPCPKGPEEGQPHCLPARPKVRPAMSNCCWCGQGFSGSSYTGACAKSPHGKHEHVAGHTDRVNLARQEWRKPEVADHAELHPTPRPITLCVWCGSGYAEGETCDERPNNAGGRLGHQTLTMAQRSVDEDVRRADAHWAWLQVREALDKGDAGEAMYRFSTALSAARHAGRREAEAMHERRARARRREGLG